MLFPFQSTTMDPNPPLPQSSFIDYGSLAFVPNTRNHNFTNQNDNTANDGNPVRGSIAERRAAKCGFKAERINTARFRTTSPLASPSAAAAATARSPCITIPAGISPTALLDSPIMLPNSQVKIKRSCFELLDLFLFLHFGWLLKLRCIYV